MRYIPRMEREQLIETLKELRPDLAAEGVTHLAIFGSRARGDHKPDSDVDLLVEVDPSKQFSILDIIGVQHHVTDRTGIATNALMRRSLRADFQRRIEKDIVEVF
jgi:predicted nucleotidyltransferase